MENLRVDSIKYDIDEITMQDKKINNTLDLVFNDM